MSAVKTLHPCFDNTVELVSFDQSSPMDYSITKFYVNYTNSGIKIISEQNEAESSSSSD